MSQGVIPKAGTCHRGVGSRDIGLGSCVLPIPLLSTALHTEGSSFPMEERGHSQAPLYPLFCPPTPNPSPSPTTSIPSVKAGGGLQRYQGAAPCQEPPLHGALPGIPHASPTQSVHQPSQGGAQQWSWGRAITACLGARAHGHRCIFRCCFWSIKHWICWVVARGHGQGMGAVGSTPSPARMAQAPALHEHTCPTSVTPRVYLTPYCPGLGVHMAAASRHCGEGVCGVA